MRSWLNRARLPRPVQPHRTSDLRPKLGDILGTALNLTQNGVRERTPLQKTRETFAAPRRQVR
jgi:hypothetical protein